MNFDDVSYTEVPSDEECIVNAVQIGKQLNLPPHIIRSWGDEFEEYLYIKKTNGRMTYTQKSISQFEWIKAMRDKGYGIKHIREQLKLKGFTHEDNNLGIINPNDINLMESIKIEIGIEMKNQLKNFFEDFLKNQEQTNIDLVSDIKTEIEQTVQEQLENSMADVKKQLELQEQENKSLNKQLEDIKQSMDENNRLAEMSNKLREKELERKQTQEEQSHQSFFNRLGELFHKNK